MRRSALTLVLATTLAATSSGCEGAHGDDPSEAPTAAPQAARTARPVPAGTFEGDPVSLLDQYAERDPATAREAATWTLPFKAKRMVVALLIAAARDRLQDLPLILAADATWGLPDRRQLGERPVFAGDGGAAFFDALRASAARLRGVLEGQAGRGATFNCPPMSPGAQEAVRTGAEPYWCYYISDDNLDLLVFRLQVIAGRGRITYVGLFERRPTGPIAVGRTDPPPPFVPPMLRDPSAAPPPPLPRAPRPTPPG